jgi:hypothetical protein
MEAFCVLALDDVGPFLLAFVLDLEDKLRFDIFDEVRVTLLVENQLKTLIKPFIDGILDDLNARLGGSLRHIDRHIRKGILEEHALGDSPGLFCNSENPSDVRVVFLLFSHLHHSVPVGIEEVVGVVLVTDSEGIGIRGVCHFVGFDNIVLPRTPISKDQLARFQSRLEHQGRLRMHKFMQFLLPYKLDHPNLIEIMIFVMTKRGLLTHIFIAALLPNHEHIARNLMEDVVVVSRSKLYFLDRMFDNA